MSNDIQHRKSLDSVQAEFEKQCRILVRERKSALDQVDGLRLQLASDKTNLELHIAGLRRRLNTANDEIFELRDEQWKRERSMRLAESALASAHDTLRHGLSRRSRARSPSSPVLSPPLSPLLQPRSPITPPSMTTATPTRNMLVSRNMSPDSSVSTTPLLLPSFGLAASQLTAMSDPFSSEPFNSTTPLNSPPQTPGRLKHLTSLFTSPDAYPNSPMSPRVIRTPPTSMPYSSPQSTDVSARKPHPAGSATFRRACAKIDSLSSTGQPHSSRGCHSALSREDKLIRYSKFYDDVSQVLGTTALHQFKALIHAFSSDNIPLSGPSGILRQGRILIEGELGKTAYSSGLIDEFEQVIREDSAIAS
ncbi:hypothetical protein CALVIDRAFT_554122 [Calocera viscosa TUFC12733]|uniref:Uncharacterized protein n=1 Tax=Calocera viscosa (strain TUFC12733) TaxID=1330018 RepID=A0A167NT33_CALVF|nr:hypothetical protein CALVIDRAFT_554122 [Calocera viscosa TUFC12733]